MYSTLAMMIEKIYHQKRTTFTHQVIKQETVGCHEVDYYFSCFIYRVNVL